MTIRVSATGAQTYGAGLRRRPPASLASSPAPINMGSATDQVYLVQFMPPGVHAASEWPTSQVTVERSQHCMVFYAGSARAVQRRLDQINVLLPASLAGSRERWKLQVTGSGASPRTRCRSRFM
jgi:hypothetical protein